MVMIPYGHQSIDQNDIDQVIGVLKSDYITQGDCVPKFERALHGYTGARHAVAVSSGTAALHIACLALELQPGDYLWTSPISFVASANCAYYCGAKVDFVDIDPHTWTLSISALEEKLALAERQGVLPKIVVPVDFAGLSCDMQALRCLADKYHFSILEDACHALGGHYQTEPIGNCRYSDITVFSFHPVKPITTGEGGAALTNNGELARKLQLLREHGITRETHEMQEPSAGPWYYEQVMLGFNYRMTDIQAALGSSQIGKLNSFIEKREQVYESYRDKLQQLPLEMQFIPQECESSHHILPLRLTMEQQQQRGQSGASPLSKREIFEAMRKQGIGVNLHYIPIYRQPFYRQHYGVQNSCPNAEHYYQGAITLPLFVKLTEEQVALVCKTLARILE